MTKHFSALNIVRIGVFTALCLLATLPALTAYGALSNLWADYKDSDDAVYIVVGGVALLLALVPAGIAFLSMRGAPRPVAAVGIAAGAIAVTGLAFWLVTDAGRRGREHIQERRAPVAAPTPNPSAPGPRGPVPAIATVSIASPEIR